MNWTKGLELCLQPDIPIFSSLKFNKLFYYTQKILFRQIFNGQITISIISLVHSNCACTLYHCNTIIWYSWSYYNALSSIH